MGTELADASGEGEVMHGLASAQVLHMTDGQRDLPRWFAQVFAVARQLNNGRLDFVLPDGRRFRAELCLV